MHKLAAGNTFYLSGGQDMRWDIKYTTLILGSAEFYRVSLFEIV